MQQQRYHITNSESGLCFDSIVATSERDALVRWMGRNAYADERLVQGVGSRDRPYVTGDHGACYIARVAPDPARCPSCGGPLEGWAGEHHSQQCEIAAQRER